ncbi:MAG TPA: hypothetical protein VGR89_07695 [Puia sp.]|nr:hypothetical protein [Puia sp.]
MGQDQLIDGFGIDSCVPDGLFRRIGSHIGSVGCQISVTPGGDTGDLFEFPQDVSGIARNPQPIAVIKFMGGEIFI